MANSKGFTARSSGIANVLKTNCAIGAAFDPKIAKKPYPISKQFNAIWDTGATNSCITSTVAKDLGLAPMGKINSHNAAGVSLVNTYIVNLSLPQGVTVGFVKVSEAILPPGTDVLIGMDIINMGDFSISNANGKTTFSFRIPSIKEIDLTVGNKVSMSSTKASKFKKDRSKALKGTGNRSSRRAK